MPAPTASRLAAYSSAPIRGYEIAAFGAVVFCPAAVLVRGKLPHRLRDLGRIGHEELLLRGVEGHGGDVRPGYAHHGPVQTVERVLRDDRRDLRSESAREVVLVHDYRLARLAHGFENGFSVEGSETPEVDHLDAQAVGRQLFRGLQAVMGHEAPRKAA